MVVTRNQKRKFTEIDDDTLLQVDNTFTNISVIKCKKTTSDDDTDSTDSTYITDKSSSDNDNNYESDLADTQDVKNVQVEENNLQNIMNVKFKSSEIQEIIKESIKQLVKKYDNNDMALFEKIQRLYQIITMNTIINITNLLII